MIPAIPGRSRALIRPIGLIGPIGRPRNHLAEAGFGVGTKTARTNPRSELRERTRDPIVGDIAGPKPVPGSAPKSRDRTQFDVGNDIARPRPRAGPSRKSRERTRDQNCANEPEARIARTNPRPKVRDRTRDGIVDDLTWPKPVLGSERKLRKRTQDQNRATEPNSGSSTILPGRGQSRLWIGLIGQIQLIGSIGRRRSHRTKLISGPARKLRERAQDRHCANEPERESDPRKLNLLINSLARRITHRLQVSYSASAGFSTDRSKDRWRSEGIVWRCLKKLEDRTFPAAARPAPACTDEVIEP
jgi:hypothetical protein